MNFPYNVIIRNDSAIAEAFAKENLYFLQCVLGNYCQGKIVLTPSCCEQSWNMVKHVCINVNHSIVWWLTIWKPCHRHDVTMEYQVLWG